MISENKVVGLIPIEISLWNLSGKCSCQQDTTKIFRVFWGATGINGFAIFPPERYPPDYQDLLWFSLSGCGIRYHGQNPLGVGRDTPLGVSIYLSGTGSCGANERIQREGSVAKIPAETRATSCTDQIQLLEEPPNYPAAKMQENHYSIRETQSNAGLLAATVCGLGIPEDGFQPLYQISLRVYIHFSPIFSSAESEIRPLKVCKYASNQIDHQMLGSEIAMAIKLAPMWLCKSEKKQAYCLMLLAHINNL